MTTTAYPAAEVLLWERQHELQVAIRALHRYIALVGESEIRDAERALNILIRHALPMPTDSYSRYV